MGTMARKTVSSKAAELLDALRQCGPGWHSRAELAAQLGKNRLNASEVTVLETLVDRGQVEAEQHETEEGNIPQRWEYRAKA